ncbi:MAG TPA: hypothetical protein VFS01_13620 [Rhizomicrobium sp.]|jgi:hypothetical protein|nr:hypothetical protein [Rhizomicrobium sp.]
MTSEQEKPTEPQGWIFFARILPERVPLTFQVPPVEVCSPHFGVKLKFHETNSDRGQVSCRTTLLEGQPDIFFVRNLLEQHLRAIIDFFGYQQGLSFDLDIVSATSLTGETFNFGIGIPGLMNAHKAKPGTHELPVELVKAAILDSGANIALAQFRKAMREATGTGFYCYQAIEALMQSVRLGSDTDTQGWQRFRETLNIDRSAIDFVKSHADDRRHGRTANISDAERLKVFLICDEVIRRYLEFVVRGRGILNAGEFELLNSSQLGNSC